MGGHPVVSCSPATTSRSGLSRRAGQTCKLSASVQVAFYAEGVKTQWTSYRLPVDADTTRGCGLRHCSTCAVMLEVSSCSLASLHA